MYSMQVGHSFMLKCTVHVDKPCTCGGVASMVPWSAPPFCPYAACDVLDSIMHVLFPHPGMSFLPNDDVLHCNTVAPSERSVLLAWCVAWPTLCVHVASGHGCMLCATMPDTCLHASALRHGM